MSALATALAPFAIQFPSQVLFDGSAVADDDDDAADADVTASSQASQCMWQNIPYFFCTYFFSDISAPPSLSSSACSSSRPSISTGSSVSNPIFRHKQVLSPSRRNEHLAVILPKNLWKV